MDEQQTLPRTKTGFGFTPEGVYIGTVQAWLDPENPGEYVLPANATFDAPEYDPNTETVVRVGDYWEKCPNVARTFYHRETGAKLSVIDHPAFLPDAETYQETEPDFIIAEREKAALREQLAPLYSRALDAMVETMATPEEKAILERLRGLQ